MKECLTCKWLDRQVTSLKKPLEIAAMITAQTNHMNQYHYSTAIVKKPEKDYVVNEEVLSG